MKDFSDGDSIEDIDKVNPSGGARKKTYSAVIKTNVNKKKNTDDPVKVNYDPNKHPTSNKYDHITKLDNHLQGEETEKKTKNIK